MFREKLTILEPKPTSPNDKKKRKKKTTSREGSLGVLIKPRKQVKEKPGNTGKGGSILIKRRVRMDKNTSKWGSEKAESSRYLSFLQKENITKDEGVRTRL